MAAPSKSQSPSMVVGSGLVIMLLALLAYGYKLTSVNIYNQLPAILSLLDPELFSQDFYVQEMTLFTPRYYYYHLISLGIKLGFDLNFTCAILFLAAFIAYLSGLYALGKFVGKSTFSATLVTFLGFAATVNGRIGFADLFRSTPIPATLAMGIAVWGIYLCLRGRWFWGYACFGVTCLLQFLVGALPGILMAMPLLRSNRKTQGWKQVCAPFLILFSFACLVYVPMLLSGNTGSGFISGQEFVSLYANIRHPHHLLFSSFGLMGSRGWLNFGLFTIGGILCIHACQTLSTVLKRQLCTIIYVTCAVLVVNFIFVEVYPLDLIAKLQFARTTPFSQLAILLGIAVLADELRRAGNWPVAGLLIISPLISGAGLVLFPVAYGLWLERQSKYQNRSRDLMIWAWGIFALLLLALDEQWYGLVGGLVLAIALIGWCFRPQDLVRVAAKAWIKWPCLLLFLFLIAYEFFPLGLLIDALILMWVLPRGIAPSPTLQKLAGMTTGLIILLDNTDDFWLLLAIASPFLIQKLIKSAITQRRVMLALATVLSLYCGLGYLQLLPAALAAPFDGQIKMAAQPKRRVAELAELAQDFRELSPKDALVLVPPQDEAFRFYSQRSVVFSFKGFPFTDGGIQAWRERLEVLMGVEDIFEVEAFSSQALDERYAGHSGEKLVAIAQRFQATHILTRADWHSDLALPLVVQRSDWRIYEIGP